MSSDAVLPRSRWRIGRYSVIERIGRGGMGMVYRARDDSLERDIAIKILTAEGLRDSAARRRFEIEAKAAAQLQHPNIVTIYELGEERGVPFIAMELLGGTDLEALMRSGESLVLEEKVEIVLQVCRGLAYAHERGIVHRDIKPSNIRVLDDGAVKIVDFGIAKLGGVNLTQSGMVVGTVHYMSPEQVRGQPLDGRSDIFSLGVILFELLNGTRPFEGASATDVLYKIVHAPLPAMAVPNVPQAQALKCVTERALARPIGERYPSAHAMAQHLETVAGEQVRDAADVVGVTPGIAEARRLLAAGDVDKSIGCLTAILTTHPEALDARRALRAAQRMRTVPLPVAGTPGDDLAELAATLGMEPSVAEPAAPATGGDAAPLRRRPTLLWLGAALVALALGAGVLLIWAATGRAPAPVPIEVRSSPQGAHILVDGHDTGLVTDARIVPPDAPRFLLTLRRPGFRDYVESVDLPRRESAPLAATLTPTTTHFRVASDPPGARVFLDGAFLDGTTPMEVTLDTARPHTMTMSLAGHKPVTRRVRAGEPISEWSASLPAAAPPVDVLVDAAYGVEVSEDGRKLAAGTGSLHVSLTPGTHVLTIVSSTHFLRLSRRVEVAGGERQTITLPAVGHINVQARPDNCEVYIDGFFADYPPILARAVVAGTHKIRFRWPDGSVEDQTIDVGEGQPTFVTGRKP